MNERERERTVRSQRPRRSRRRRKQKLPFSLLFLTAAAFALALLLPSNEPEKPADNGAVPQQMSAPVSQEPQPVLPPSAGVEPIIPSDSTDSWKLTLVNPWNALPEGYAPTLTQLSNGHSVDSRCYPDLQDMLDACRAAGNSPLICSSYRSQEKQESLFQNKVDRLLAQGWSEADAPAEAAKTVALPGTSEHQLGLAVDIVDVNNQLLDESQEDTAVQQWLIEHSWEYGFILRYPNDKSEVTGIIYEPWHYRYVGREAAEEIHTLGVCLEEYLSQS